MQAKLGMAKGSQVTPNLIDRAKIIIKRHFDDKGFKNAEINIVESEDPANKEQVYVDVNIDIVKYSEDPAQYVANALSPAKVLSTDVNEEEKICRVVVPDYQLSLAIGKEGQNARLAAKLTGWKIDIKSETQAAEEPFTGFGNAEDGE